MARVVVEAEQFVASDWPPLCAMTGRPTTHAVEFDATSSAPGTGFLVVFGVLPMLVAQGISERDRAISSRIPMSPAAYRTLRRAVEVRNVCLAGGIGGGFVVALLALAVRPQWMLSALGLAVVGAVGVLAASFEGWRAMPHFRLSDDRDYVWISNVHPRFVQALRAPATTP